MVARIDFFMKYVYNSSNLHSTSYYRELVDSAEIDNQTAVKKNLEGEVNYGLSSLINKVSFLTHRANKEVK